MSSDSIQIHLNSKNADKYNYLTTDCDFQLPIIDIPEQHYIFVSVVHAVIPYTFYNIDSTNNVLNYSYNNTTFNLQITSGNYNAIQLASYLQTIMGSFTITYDIIRNKLLFTNNDSINFSFLSSSTCLTLLGFVSNTTYTSSSYKLTSPYVVNLLTKNCICILSNLQTGNINNADKYNGSILCSIPVSGPPYSLITYTNSNNFRSNLYANNLNEINIKITDSNNNLIDLNNCYWSITLQIDIVNFAE